MASQPIPPVVLVYGAPQWSLSPMERPSSIIPMSVSEPTDIQLTVMPPSEKLASEEEGKRCTLEKFHCIVTENETLKVEAEW